MAWALTMAATAVSLTGCHGLTGPGLSQQPSSEPLQLTLNGHSGRVHKVAFSPSGAKLATAGSDGLIKVWLAAEGRELNSLMGHKNSVWSLVFLDETTLASCGEDTRVCLWDVTTARLIRTMPWHTRAVVSMAYDARHKRLVTASRDHTAKIWDACTGNELAYVPANSSVSDIAISPNGQLLATAGTDYELRFWTAAGQGPLSPAIPRQRSGTYSVSFSPNGRLLATAGVDGRIRLWDSGSGELTRTLPGHSKGCWSVGFSPDGQVMASGGRDRMLRLWNVASGECLTALRQPQTVTCVVFSPSGKYVAAACFDGGVRIWNVANLTSQARQETEDDQPAPATVDA